jgi:hypothetical protein
MALRTQVRIFLLCGLLGACAAEKHGLADGGAGAGARDATVDAEVSVGDAIDVDGDGKTDGEAVDTNDDGVVDGVDTDGDGDVDEPLPTGMTPATDAGGLADATSRDGGVLIVADSGPTPFPMNDAGQVLCGAGPCACSNGKDDDMDGVSDMADPECVSAWDNDEGSFATGMSGDNRDEACQDCFFDGNSGSGNDGCRLPTSCLSMGNASSGRGGCNSCEQTDKCKSFCKAYTPNGCDCFGCCTVRLQNGSNVNVALGSGCQIDGNNVTGCNTCVPNDSCRNECGKCELCPGKTLADLPADCLQTPPNDAGTPNDAGPPPPSHTCDDGATACGAGMPSCAGGFSCSFGCCVLIPTVF